MSPEGGARSFPLWYIWNAEKVEVMIGKEDR